MILNVNSSVFLSIESAVDWLLDNNIVTMNRICLRCTTKTTLGIYNDRGSIKVGYKCPKKGCQKRFPLYSSKIELNKVIQIWYFLILNSSYSQLFFYYGITNATISKHKKVLVEAVNLLLKEREVHLGGPDIVVEVDETVISRRGIIKNPTTTEDELKDTIWIVGGIDSQRNFFIERVPNRKVTTMTALLGKYIRKDSVLQTDGHPSYPLTAKKLGMKHVVVNHSRGFINEDGDHTNNIEGFWSHLKGQMRKENGVKRNDIEEWIQLYTFKRRYILNATREEFSDIFIQLIKKIFNK